jgi:hypothetical protein
LCIRFLAGAVMVGGGDLMSSFFPYFKIAIKLLVLIPFGKRLLKSNPNLGVN